MKNSMRCALRAGLTPHDERQAGARGPEQTAGEKVLPAGNLTVKS
jgi:hypothetical protein